MRNKMVWLTVLILIVTLTLTACSSGPKDLTAGKTAQQIVEQSFDQWYQLSNYDMDMSTQMKMTMGSEVMDMAMTGKITAFQKPMKMKMDLTANMPGMPQMQVTQYIFEEGQNLTLYQQINGEWQKAVFNDPSLAKMASMDPRDNLKLFMDNLVKAEMVGEEKIGDKTAVKISIIASSKIFDEVLKESAGQSLGIGTDMFSSDIFSKIGDMKYLIWIDKMTLETIKCQMDLTENVKNLGKALQEDPNAPAALKQASEIFGNMEISMEYTVMNQNKAQDFTLPEEAKNAKEMPMQ